MKVMKIVDLLKFVFLGSNVKRIKYLNYQAEHVREYLNHCTTDGGSMFSLHDKISITDPTKIIDINSPIKFSKFHKNGTNNYVTESRENYEVTNKAEFLFNSNENLTLFQYSSKSKYGFVITIFCLFMFIVDKDPYTLFFKGFAGIVLFILLRTYYRHQFNVEYNKFITLFSLKMAHFHSSKKQNS